MTILRKCFVLREVEVHPSEIKPGDILRFGRATPEDTFCDEHELFQVESAPRPCAPDGNWKMNVDRIGGLKPRRRG